MPNDLTVSWTAAKWHPHKIIENVTGFELTPATAVMVRDWPEDKRVELVERLAASVVGSLAFDPEPPPASPDDTSFGSIDRQWRADGGQYALPNFEIRQQLLFLPKVCVADHFSRFMLDLDPTDVARSFEFFNLFGKQQKTCFMDGWLESVCALAPALREGAVQLVIPCAQREATAMLEAAQPLQNSSELRIQDVLAEACFAYADDLQAAPDCANAFELTTGGSFWNVNIPDPVTFFRDVSSTVASKTSAEVWAAINIPDRLARGSAANDQASGRGVGWEVAASMAMRGLHRAAQGLMAPALASNLALGIKSTSGALSAVACMKLYGLQAAEDGLSKKKRNVAHMLSRFRIPNAGSAPIELLLSVRQNEKVFGDVRRAVGDVVNQIASCNPQNQAQFELELQQSLDDLLTPKIEALQKSTKSSFLEKAMIPGSMTLGAGAVVLAATQQFPPTAIAAAALAPAAYLADRLYKRYRASGRKDTRLVEALIVFRDMGRANQRTD